MTCMVAKYSSFSDSVIAAAVDVPAELHRFKSSSSSAAAGSEEERKSQSSKSFPPAWVHEASGSAGRCNGCSAVHQAGHLGLPEAWWEGQLAESIHRTLQQREKLLDTVKLASPQLHKRVGLIDFTSTVCKYLPFSDTTRHLAVLLLDHFMEKHSIMEYRLKLVALTCLLVAAKMEDRDDYLPTIGHLRSLAKLEKLAEYSRDNFQRMELYLMKFFSWSISYPTAAHFIGYYNANSFQSDSSVPSLPDLPLCGVLPETDFLDFVAELDLMEPMESISEVVEGVNGIEGRVQTPGSFVEGRTLECGEQAPEGITALHVANGEEDLVAFHYQLEEITASLLEKALRDYRFLQYPPSMVAAGAVCVARTYMKLFPAWTTRLELVSSYTMDLLNPVVELFLGNNDTSTLC